MDTLTIKFVANALNISEQRVRTLCRESALISKKFGRSWMIDAESFSNYQNIKINKVAEDHPSYKITQNKPIALSFFSGAMGLDLGIEQAGFDIRLACEVDRFCRKTILINRPNTALIGDINNYTADQILSYAGLSRSDDVDLVFGGPPCQAFSTAGKRKGFEDTRGNAFITYLKLAFDIKPKFIVIENVRGLLSCPMSHRPHEMRGVGYSDLALDELPGGALYFVLSYIKSHGYSFSFNLYNSANFGTPQIRERVVIICSRCGDKPPYLVPTHTSSDSKLDGLLQWKTLRQSIEGLKQHNYLTFPEKRLRFYRLLLEGQNWKSLPENLQREALGKAFFSGGGKTGFLRRLAWDKPAPTLLTHPAMPATDLAHPEEDRPLSIEEYKRIQEFPDDWVLAGSLLEQYKQVGNAVPISLGKAIGKLVISLLYKKEIPQVTNFAYSRYRDTCDQSWIKNFERSVSLQEKSFSKQGTLF